ncbi:MAG: DUF6067 family protein [Armatimonadetes bacterium]|nr:DUF6067 family protein [Armatimonadota bacterium]
MKHRFGITFGPGTPGLRLRNSALFIAFMLGVMLIASASALAGVSPVIVFRTAPGTDYQLYVPSAKDTVTLAGTASMNNVVIGDVDGDGAEDEMVYSSAVGGKLGYYKIPGDGLWHPEQNYAIPNTPIDAVPLTVLRTGGLGTIGRIVYASQIYRKSYSISPTGTQRRVSVWMDKAYAADVRQRGIKSDLVWWTNGVGMRWRAGFTGYDHKAPYPDWVPIGCGKLDATVPARVMAFYASDDYDPTVYFTDRNWNLSKVKGSHWPWTVNRGSTVIGDVDDDGVDEIVTCMSSIHPLQWYNVPPKDGSFDFYSLVTIYNILPAWNIAGVARVNMPAVTPPPPSPPPPPTVVNIANISELANLEDGTLVQLAPKSQTKMVNELDADGSIAATGYYIEETDCSSGIRIIGQTNAVEGQQIAIKGILDTLNGERVIIADTQAVSTSNMKIAAISSTIESVLETAAMTGLLVSVSGSIASADIASGTLDFTDGMQAIKVYAPENTNTSGQFTLIGCVGAENNDVGAAIPVLRVESSSDMIAPDRPENLFQGSIWTATSLEKILKTDPVKNLQTPVIKAAKGEHEAFQVVLRGGASAVSSVTISASDLTSGASTISASNVSVFLASYIYLPDYKQDYPDALPPYQKPFTLGAGETKPIWLDVAVPKTAAEGDYTGKITITDASGAKTEIPYVLHVYNFALPDANKYATAFQFDPYEMAIQHKIDRHSTQGFDLEKIYSEFMLNHGVCPFVIPTGTDIFSADGAKYLTDPRLSATLIPWTTNATYLTNSMNRFESLGVLNKGYFYLADEIWSMAHVASVKNDCTYVHSIKPAALAMATVVDDPRASAEPRWVSGRSYAVGEIVCHGDEGPYYWQDYLYKCKVAHTSSAASEPVLGADRDQYWSQIKIIDELTGYTNLWCIGIKFWETRVAPALEARRQAGDTLWGCTALDPKFFIQSKPMDLRVLTWQSYHYACTGFLYWKVDFWSSSVPDPWTSADTLGVGNTYGRYGEGSLFYPGYQVGINGPVTSIRMETLRDSVEDYQYFWLLEQKIGRAGVKAYTDQIATLWNSYNGDASALASVRDQIAQRIEAP